MNVDRQHVVVTLGFKLARIAAGWRGAYSGSVGSVIYLGAVGQIAWRYAIIIPFAGAIAGASSYWLEGRRQP